MTPRQAGASVLFVLLGVVFSASAEVGQKRSKCEEGIGCRDEQKKVPEASKNNRSGLTDKATSPGLGVGVTGDTRIPGGRFEPLPGSGGYAGSKPAEQAFANEVCSSRQAQMDREGYVSSRRVVAPDLDATDCIELIELRTRNGYFGPGFKNSCPYPVFFRFCAYRPLPNALGGAIDCEKTDGRIEIIESKEEIVAHTYGAESIYFGGCRHPEATPANFIFVPGQSYKYQCMAWVERKVRDAVAKRKASACEIAEIAHDAAVEQEVERLRAQVPELIALAKQDQIEELARRKQQREEEFRQARAPTQQVQLAQRPVQQQQTQQTNLNSSASTTPRISGNRQSSDGYHAVTLVDRWTGTWESQPLLRVPESAYDQTLANFKKCRTSVCGPERPPSESPYAYDVGSIVNPFKVSGTVPRQTPNCKYTPQAGYGLPYLPGSRSAFGIGGGVSGEQTCAYLLQAAIHEWMENKVGGSRGASALINSAAVMPGTATGQCEADLQAYRASSKDVRGKASPMDMRKSLQAAMYLEVNMYRILTTSCKGTSHADRADFYLQAAGQSLKTCQVMTSDPKVCVPKIP